MEYMDNKELKKKINEYRDFILESLDYGAYETAQMYSDNLNKFLKEYISGDSRFCTDCDQWEQK